MESVSLRHLGDELALGELGGAPGSSGEERDYLPLLAELFSFPLFEGKSPEAFPCQGKVEMSPF
jgi:hypothetical protein